MGCASHNMRQVPVQDCPLAARAVVNTIGADHQTQRGQGNIPDGCLYAPEIQQTYSKEATNLVQTTTTTSTCNRQEPVGFTDTPGWNNNNLVTTCGWMDHVCKPMSECKCYE